MNGFEASPRLTPGHLAEVTELGLLAVGCMPPARNEAAQLLEGLDADRRLAVVDAAGRHLVQRGLAQPPQVAGGIVLAAGPLRTFLDAVRDNDKVLHSICFTAPEPTGERRVNRGIVRVRGCSSAPLFAVATMAFAKAGSRPETDLPVRLDLLEVDGLVEVLLDGVFDVRASPELDRTRVLVVIRERAEHGLGLERSELRVGVNRGTPTLTRPRRGLLRTVSRSEATTRVSAGAHLRELLTG